MIVALSKNHDDNNNNNNNNDNNKRKRTDNDVITSKKRCSVIDYYTNKCKSKENVYPLVKGLISDLSYLIDECHYGESIDSTEMYIVELYNSTETLINEIISGVDYSMYVMQPFMKCKNKRFQKCILPVSLMNMMKGCDFAATKKFLDHVTHKVRLTLLVQYALYSHMKREWTIPLNLDEASASSKLKWQALQSSYKNDFPCLPNGLILFINGRGGFNVGDEFTLKRPFNTTLSICEVVSYDAIMKLTVTGDNVKGMPITRVKNITDCVHIQHNVTFKVISVQTDYPIIMRKKINIDIADHVRMITFIEAELYIKK